MMPYMLEAQEEVEEIFNINESSPIFIGCEDENHNAQRVCSSRKAVEYIQKHFRYSNLGCASGIVIVEFVVNKHGLVDHIRLLRNPGAGHGKEVVRIIKTMNHPKMWTPATFGGKKIDRRIRLPIRIGLL